MRRAATLLLSLFALVGVARAERTDVLVLRNGDQLTGEVKSLDQGILNFKTDNMSTLEVKWTAVARLVSIHTFEIELSKGALYWGTLEDSGVDGQLALKTASGRQLLAWSQVVRIGTVKDGLWDRVDGNASLGFSYTKASGVGQASFGLDALYRARSSQWGLSASSIVTSQEAQSTTRRADFALSFHRDTGSRWFWTGATGLQQNDELGLQLRTSLKAAYGRRLIQNSISQFALSGGLTVNRENPLVGDSQDNTEGVFTVDWRVFRHSSPKQYTTVTINVLPSLTQSGRVRSESDIRYRHELVTDLFFELKFYGSTDSQPVAAEAGKTDYGIVTSIAFSF